MLSIDPDGPKYITMTVAVQPDTTVMSHQPLNPKLIELLSTFASQQVCFTYEYIFFNSEICGLIKGMPNLFKNGAETICTARLENILTLM